MIKTLCDLFDVKMEDKPILVEILKQKSVGFHTQMYLYRKPEHPEYKGLHRIEDLLVGKHYEMACLISSLVRAGKLHEAKGLFLRNNIPRETFENNLTDHVS